MFKKIKYSIVVTTYNRETLICDFISQISACYEPLPEQIIVVDSSDQINKRVSAMENVIYVRSSHKNQPYQRFLGLQFVTTDVVIFFDDDSQFLRKDIFQAYLSPLSLKEVVASTLHCKSQPIDQATSCDQQIIQRILQSKLWYIITGVAQPQNGKIGLNGKVGTHDETTQYTEVFSGSAGLAVYVHIARKVFDDNTLFALFEKRLALPEDKFIGMGVAMYGKIAYNHIEFLLHPDHPSTYAENIFLSSRRDLLAVYGYHYAMHNYANNPGGLPLYIFTTIVYGA